VKIKNIFLIAVLALLLTGCAAKVEELRQKIQTKKGVEKETIEEVEEEAKKDPSEMSLEEIEEELEGMKDIEVDEGLDEIEEEL